MLFIPQDINGVDEWGLDIFLNHRSAMLLMQGQPMKLSSFCTICIIGGDVYSHFHKVSPKIGKASNWSNSNFQPIFPSNFLPSQPSFAINRQRHKNKEDYLRGLNKGIKHLACSCVLCRRQVLEVITFLLHFVLLCLLTILML